MALLKVHITQHDHVLGNPQGRVTLVEYGDYQCPHCAAAQPFLKQIEARYDNDLCFVFRHFPLIEVHPLAGTAAETAEFAGSQGVFWPMHEAIFANQPQLSLPLLISLATKLKLPSVGLRDALAAHIFAQKVQADFIGGVRSGVNGTPTFFINGVRHDSPYGVLSLASAIEGALHAAA